MHTTSNRERVPAGSGRRYPGWARRLGPFLLMLVAVSVLPAVQCPEQSKGPSFADERCPDGEVFYVGTPVTLQLQADEPLVSVNGYLEEGSAAIDIQRVNDTSFAAAITPHIPGRVCVGFTGHFLAAEPVALPECCFWVEEAPQVDPGPHDTVPEVHGISALARGLFGLDPSFLWVIVAGKGTAIQKIDDGQIPEDMDFREPASLSTIGTIELRLPDISELPPPPRCWTWD